MLDVQRLVSLCMTVLLWVKWNFWVTCTFIFPQNDCAELSSVFKDNFDVHSCKDPKKKCKHVCCICRWERARFKHYRSWCWHWYRGGKTGHIRQVTDGGWSCCCWWKVMTLNCYLKNKSFALYSELLHVHALIHVTWLNHLHTWKFYCILEQ